MIGHTAFLMTSRRLAPGVDAPARQRRPAKNAELEAALGLSGLPGEPDSPRPPRVLP
jgi:tRNA (adenine57-N1/adenine58-N1)-methyltransferase